MHINTALIPAAKNPSISPSFMKLASSNNSMLCAAFPQSIQDYHLYCTILSLLPLGPYSVHSGRTWFHYCQMISVSCRVLIGVTAGYCINNTHLIMPLWWQGLSLACLSRSTLSFVSVIPGRRSYLFQKGRLMYRKETMLFLLSSTNNAH